MKRTPLVLVTLLAAACAPRIQPLQPTLRNGAVLPATGEGVTERARAAGEIERERLTEERLALQAEALAGCAPAQCDALARGEVVPGMTEAQVLAATRTTTDAWETRGSGVSRVMTARGSERGPADAASEIALVSLQNGRVRSLVRREPQGMRTVASPTDATLAARSAAQADALLRQGDDFTLRGDLRAALDRYDRADVLRPGDAQTTLRIAGVLDKSLRPVEAQLRYRQAIHQLELERIRAEGEAAARIAAAIAAARERIVVLERR